MHSDLDPGTDLNSPPNIRWYSSKVSQGNRVGTGIGYPTINLSPSDLGEKLEDLERGVYAAWVRLPQHGAPQDGTASEVGVATYMGALYLGPRQVFGETKTVLEIHLLEFSGDLYGQSVQFCLVKFIRGITELESIEALQKQLAKDIENVRLVLENSDDIIKKAQ